MQTISKIIFIILLSFTSALIPAQLYAQDSSKVHFEAQLLQSVSFTGFSAAPVVALRRKGFQFHLGPRLVLFKSYSFEKMPFGVNAGLSYFPNHKSKSRFPSFMQVDYQSMYKYSYCPDGACDRNRHRTDEFTVGYGFRFPMGKYFDLSSSVNIGFYQEHFATIENSNAKAALASNAILRVGIHYRFYDR